LPVPMADKESPSLKCDPSPVNLFPIVIQNGVAGANDVVTVRYSTTALGAIPVKIGNNAPIGNLAIDNNLGCEVNDTVLINEGASCIMTTVADRNGSSNNESHIGLAATTPLGAPLSIGAKLTCMGNWRDYRYEIINNQLVLNGVPIVSDVVNMQAQYGISASANSNVVNAWVNATAPWDAPSIANRNRIKAIRIVVVARNGLLEKEVVTNTCTTSKGTVNNGPCAWDDTDFDAAPAIDLSADANWQNYRYRAFETIIPIRNLLWAKDAL